jgi:hypothetical protein
VHDKQVEDDEPAPEDDEDFKDEFF